MVPPGRHLDSGAAGGWVALPLSLLAVFSMALKQREPQNNSLTSSGCQRSHGAAVGTVDPSLPGPCRQPLSQNGVGAEADPVPLVTVSIEDFLHSSLPLEWPPPLTSQKIEKEGLLEQREQPWWWERSPATSMQNTH